jgi:HK97 family phage prohead protease
MKLMPWNNYPKAASENAQKALDHREEHGTDCGTPVGWQRANQLAGRESISDDVLVRTYSFLSRAKVYDQGRFFDEDGKEICGSVMFAAWGGDEMLRWAKRTIEQMKEDKNERHIKSVVETDEEIVITFGKGEMSNEQDVERVSFDFDGTLNNDIGRAYLEEEKSKGSEIYIISARKDAEYLQGFAIANGIEKERVFAMGNDDEKIAKIKSLNIVKHYDNNPSIVESVRGILVTERAEPNELAVGDFVRWNSSGGNAYGRIIQVETDGELEADSGFIVTGTPDDPSALIRIYRYDSESDAYVERKPILNVVHKFSTLEKFDAEVRKSFVVKEQREFRMESAEQNGNTIRGYAAVYNSDSEWMGGFYEQIETGAFDEVLNDDVRAYFNHDENLLLGRVSSGTLRISTDKRGLFYEVDLPKTSYANDLMELMQRGDVNQSSFAFLIERDRWEQRDGVTYRIIEKVSRLIDVSPVSMPAYPSATSELKKRDLEPETKAEVETAADEQTPESNSTESANVDDSAIYLYKSKILNF